MHPSTVNGRHFTPAWPALILCGLIAVSAVACAPEGPTLEVRQFRYWDHTMQPGEVRQLQAGTNLPMPKTDYQPYWLEFDLSRSSLPDRPFLFFRDTTFAWELWHGSLRLGNSGSVRPPIYIAYKNASTLPIPQSLIPSSGSITFRLCLLPDSYPAQVPVVSFVDGATGRLYAENLIPLNREAYRAVAMICLVLTAYFFIYFFTRKQDPSGLIAGCFNLLVVIYFFGLSQSWESMGLPLAKAFAFFKAAIIPAFLLMGFYLQTFYRRVSARRILRGSLIALVLAALTVILPRNVGEALAVFGIMASPMFIWLLGQYIRIILRRNKNIPGLWILLAGGGISIFCALFDFGHMVLGSTPLLWLQGIGVFILQLTIFMTLAKRSAKTQSNLESYAVDVESQVKAKTAELEKLNQELRSASQAKTAFLAHMSHEIRTPLNSIMGFTQLLQDSEKDETRRKHLDLILQESRILLDLINEVLDVSRIEGGKLRLDEQPFSPREVFAYSLESQATLARKRAIRLGVTTSGVFPDQVLGDSLRLQQILHNILGNAIKFTLEGEVTVDVAARTEGDRVFFDLCVRDTGIGIPADKLDRIFQSFEQVDTSITRRFGGSGLGLTIVRELVRLMDGSIRLESVQGQGTTVHVSLPFRLAPDREFITFTDTPGQDSPRPRTAGRFQPGTVILAVEDYEPNVQLLRLFLEPMGVRIVACANGADALDWLGSNKPDLIFMDLHLPDMDGYETTRSLRSRFRQHALTPVIALTADAWNDVHGRCLEAGMQGVLTKPLYLDQLVAAIKEHLGGLFEVLPAEPGPTPPPPQPDRTGPAQAAPAAGLQTVHQGGNITFAPLGEPAGRLHTGINLAVLAEHFGVEEDDVLALVEGFFAASDQLLADLAGARQTMDLGQIHLKAHTLKGGALNIQAHSLADAALLVEKAAKAGQAAGLEILLDQLYAAYQAFRADWNKRNSSR